MIGGGTAIWYVSNDRATAMSPSAIPTDAAVFGPRQLQVVVRVLGLEAERGSGGEQAHISGDEHRWWLAPRLEHLRKFNGVL